MSRYLIGIDVGTSSAKAVLMDENGAVVKVVAPEYPFETPRPLWAESDPADWWEATVKAIRGLLEGIDPGDVAAVGLTGQMHGLVLLDSKGGVLRPCVMWNDQRTGKECAELTESVGAAEVLRITGNPVLPGFTAPKIRWVQKHEPEVWDKTAHILLPKDFIRYRLTGEMATDVSDASGMALLDVGGRRWSPRMLEACGVKQGMMADVMESVAVSGRVSAEAARATGLPKGLPVAAGAGDQAAGAIGCGIVSPGVVSCTLGTSGVLFAHAEDFAPDKDGRLHAFCSAVPGKWHFMGVQLSSAGAFQWFHKTLGGGASMDELNAEAAEIAPGSEGLFFLPYLTGERTPHPDPHARGTFTGLTLRHGRAHMTRAVFEGVTFGLRDALEIMRDLGLRPKQIVASGGGAKSPLWRQILADIFATPIVTVNATEGAAYGAALLGGVRGVFLEVVGAACRSVLRETSLTEPGPARHVYDDFYAEFANLYPALRESYARTAALVEKHS